MSNLTPTSEPTPSSNPFRRALPGDRGREYATRQLERWKRDPKVEIVMIKDGALAGRCIGIHENESQRGFFVIVENNPDFEWWRFREPELLVTPYRDSGETTAGGLRIFEIGRFEEIRWPEAIERAMREHGR